MPVNETVLDAVTIGNVKTIAEAPAVLQNLALQNAVGQQSAMAGVMVALSAKAAELLMATDIAEAGGLVALLQQAMKGAGNTPPVTP